MISANKLFFFLVTFLVVSSSIFLAIVLIGTDKNDVQGIQEGLNWGYGDFDSMLLTRKVFIGFNGLFVKSSIAGVSSEKYIDYDSNNCPEDACDSCNHSMKTTLAFVILALVSTLPAFYGNYMRSSSYCNSVKNQFISMVSSVATIIFGIIALLTFSVGCQQKYEHDTTFDYDWKYGPSFGLLIAVVVIHFIALVGSLVIPVNPNAGVVKQEEDEDEYEKDFPYDEEHTFPTTPVNIPVYVAAPPVSASATIGPTSATAATSDGSAALPVVTNTDNGAASDDTGATNGTSGGDGGDVVRQSNENNAHITSNASLPISPSELTLQLSKLPQYNAVDTTAVVDTGDIGIELSGVGGVGVDGSGDSNAESKVDATAEAVSGSSVGEQVNTAQATTAPTSATAPVVRKPAGKPPIIPTLATSVVASDVAAANAAATATSANGTANSPRSPTISPRGFFSFTPKSTPRGTATTSSPTEETSRQTPRGNRKQEDEPPPSAVFMTFTNSQYELVQQENSIDAERLVEFAIHSVNNTPMNSSRRGAPDEVTAHDQA